MKTYIEQINSALWSWTVERSGRFYAGGFSESSDDAEFAASLIS